MNLWPFNWTNAQNAARHPVPPSPEPITALVAARTVIRARIYRTATGQWEDVGLLCDSDVPPTGKKE